jgi:G3E family GTPase
MTTVNMPLPMTLIAGFLGSGKTTLVNHLLRNAGGRRILVLVNDFGDIPIDEDLIKDQDGDTLTLANGCACCSMGGDLFQAFDKALSFTPAPEQILIETSGVAEPLKIADFAKAEPKLSMNAIVTLVDASNLQNTLDDPRLKSVVEDQIKAAHVVVLNKQDLVTEEVAVRVKGQLSKLNSDAVMMTAANSVIDPDLLFGLETQHETSSAHRSKTNHDQLFARASMEMSNYLTPALVKDWAEKMPEQVLRLKGVFRDSRDNAKLWVIHRVGRRIDVTRMRGLASGEEIQCGFIAIGLKEGFPLDAIETHLSQLENLTEN